MNKRQSKKLGKKLFVAVKELNDDFAISESLPMIADERAWEIVGEIKKSKRKINRTLKDYKRFIINA